LLAGATLLGFILSLLFLPPTLLFLALAFSLALLILSLPSLLFLRLTFVVLALRLSLSPLFFALASPLLLIIVVLRWTLGLLFVLLLTPFDPALSAVGTILRTSQVADAEY